MEKENAMKWEDLRNRAAVSAMQGIIANYHNSDEYKVAYDAVRFADALVNELSRGAVQQSESSESGSGVPSLLDLRLYDSPFSVKTINVVRTMTDKPAKDVTVGDLIKCSKSELLALRNFGKSSLREIEDFLAEYGLKLKGE